MSMISLNCVIPAPVSVMVGEGQCDLRTLKTVSASGVGTWLAQEAASLAAHYGMKLELTDGQGDLSLRLDDSLKAEAWKLQVSETQLVLSAGDEAGAFHGLQALRQMIAAASIRGPIEARLECGTVEDEPRFSWRGLMLDSARHFQSVATIKAVIRLMAAYRLNVLHWHLTDNQGWRLGTGIVTPETSLNHYTDGTYSREDLAEVVAYAKRHFVQIVPEFDIPGHSQGVVTAYPELACDPQHPGSEICIGKPETMDFVKKVLTNIFAIFPDSKYIHVGGDEASVKDWEACPHCQEARKAGGYADMRGLENAFMRKVMDFVMENGRTPISWGTGTAFQPGVVIQNWLDIRESLKHAANGCKVIMSVHTSYYLDYPGEPSEPQKTWMFALPAESLYMADPYVIWEDELKDSVMGPEACLWTEYVPEWRVIPKILPRLGAYAETAWSQPAKKDWHDFLKRADFLRCAGYEEDLRAE